MLKMYDNKINTDRLKENLVGKILECIPSNIKSIDYLMDILDLGRESVYRRLKGDIPFTMKEVILLSTNLDFSLDELLSEVKADHAIFRMSQKNEYNSTQGFLSTHEFYHDSMHDLYHGEENFMEITMNRAISFFIADKEALLKFFYYKWEHQFGKVPLNYFLSETKIPENIKNICKKTLFYAQRVKATFILEPHIFYNIFQEIKYFQQRGLISDKELALLKKDLKDLLCEMETLVQNGMNEAGTKVYVYISSIHIGNNSAYMVYNQHQSTYLGIHSGNSMHTNNRQICQMHKNWIDSLKKYSILISNCNEKMQAEFFNQQYSYLGDL